MPKFVIVGGGSAYTPDILLSLLQEPGLFQGWEWVLHDIDARAAGIIAALAGALIRARGLDIRVSATTDRAEALAGADYVLAQPRPGGFRHRGLDEQIPLRHGVVGQETVGPGGLAFAWRSIPVALDIAADLQRLAPRAWLISYTNPAGMVVEAVTRRYPDARFIGLCDMAPGIQFELGRVFRVAAHRLELDYRGINHGAWIDHVRVDGREDADLVPRVRALARWVPAAWLPLNYVTAVFRLVRDHGRPGDPYLRYYYYTRESLAQLRRSRETRAGVVTRRVERLYRHYAQVARQDRPVLREHRGHPAHGDLSAALIRAMVAGRRERFIIQQRNPGHLGGLPPGRAAQFPAVVSRDGWEPLPVPPLPEPQGELIRRIQAAEILNVDATLAGDRRLAVEACAANPLVPSRPVAERLVEELMAAHKPYLPTFN